ncbi:MAG TPA: TolC family protein [Thermoguttaceae bacterium]|nr:TolC family protein [Thermoguttaceae bacterium]
MVNVRRVVVLLAAIGLFSIAGSLCAQSDIKLFVGPAERLPLVGTGITSPTQPMPVSAANPTGAAPWLLAANLGSLDTSPPEAMQPTLTIAELEGMAWANNPTLVQAARQIDALRGKQLQEGLYPNPHMGYLGEEMGDDGRAGQQGGFLGQEIVTGGKLRLNRAVVGHEITMARRDWEIQCLRVTNDVRASAYDVIAAQRRVALDEQLLHIGRQGLSTAEQLFQAKEVSNVDVLQARIEANSTKLQLENARNTHQAAWQRLAAVVGSPDMQVVRLEDGLEAAMPERSWESAMTRLMESSPERARAWAEIERAKCFLARQQAERVPNFDLEAGVQYDNATRDNIASVRVAAPLKIFNRNQGNIRAAEAQLTAAHQNLRRTELQLQERLAAAFKQHVNARQQVKLYRGEILPDASRSLELVQQGYRQGEFGYLELLTAQRTYFRTHLAYVESLRTLWVSGTMIDGMLLTGGLESPGIADKSF